MRARVVLGAAGVALAGFGGFRLLTQVPPGDLLVLALWLAAAVVLHDGVIAPITVGIGWALGRTVPDRARRYLQFGLVTGALVSVVAVPLIARQGSQPAVKALLVQAYGRHLAWLLAGIAAASLSAYMIRVARDRRR